MTEESLIDISINFPLALTEEEKAMKLWQEKYRMVAKKHSVEKKPPIKLVIKLGKGELGEVEASKNTESLKRQVQKGSIAVKKSNEKNAFKRIKLGDRKSTSESRDEDEEEGEIVENVMEATTSKQSDVYAISIRGVDLQQDRIKREFGKYGTIVKMHVDNKQRTASVQYDTKQSADRAVTEMNNQMWNGITIKVVIDRTHEAIVYKNLPGIQKTVTTTPTKRKLF